MADTTYTITELAREFGLTTRAIRFYEDHGLIAPTRAGRNRVYGSRDKVRLKLTLRGKRLGLSLSEIRELIDIYDAAKDERAQVERLQQVLHKRRCILEQQREDIEAVLVKLLRSKNSAANSWMARPKPGRESRRRLGKPVNY